MILDLLLQALLNSQNGKPITASMGGHMRACSSCGQPQPHELLQIRKKCGISITNLDGYSQHYASQCEVCHKQTILANGIIPFHIERWTPDSDYHDYARRSGQPVIDLDVNLVTPGSISALLKSVTSPSPKTTYLTPADYVRLFAILGFSILLSILLFMYQAWKTPGVTTNSDVMLLLGIPVVGFIYALFSVHLNKRARNKIIQIEEFQQRVLRLGIKPHEIIHNMPQSLLQNRRIYDLLKPFI